jgi:Heavy metal binding domain
MKIKPLAPLGGLLLMACAATTPPPRFSALDPADPKAPESTVDERPLHLEGAAVKPIGPPATSEARPTAPEPALAPAPSTAEVYSCSAHPRVRQARGGPCPLCGRTLQKQPAPPLGSHQP